jgi:putative Mg2+ transporter-C (MgtC) family protein
MSVQIGWDEIVLRLVLTILAGALIGLNRGEHDRPAGLRTTMLVCLAASVSMIQMNLLLGLSGKTPSSFAVMDLMRLPLGILTGVGFIGAGAILKKGELVKGVTTAATLWYVTVVGLCLGGGQLVLGVVATFLGWIILALLKKVELEWNREHRGVLTLVCQGVDPSCQEVRRLVEDLGAEIVRWTHVQRSGPDGRCQKTCEIKCKASPGADAPPAFTEQFLKQPGVVEVDWRLRP